MKLNAAQNIFFDNIEVDQVYMNNELVWPTGSEAPSTYTTTLDFNSVSGSDWVLKGGNSSSPGSTIPSKIYTLGPQSAGYDYGNTFLWIESTTSEPFDDVSQASVFCTTNGATTQRVIAYAGRVRLQIAFNNQPSSNITMEYQGSVNPPTTPWSPSTDITTVAWIDASDSSTYTQTSENLTGVTDKSGTFTMTVNGNPQTNAVTQNGLNVFEFDGNGDYLQSTTYEAQVSSGNHWAIGVFRYVDVDSNKDTLWSYETNGSPKRDYAMSSGNSSSFPGELDLDGLSSNRISSTIGNAEQWSSKSLTQNQWHVVACWFNKSGNQIGVRVDGTNAFTPVNDYDNSLQTNQELRLMRNRSSQALDGKMGEFFAVADMPGTSGTDLTHLIKAEGYLAHKWGLESSLPSDHPYKNIAP